MARNYFKPKSFSEIEKLSERELRSYYTSIRDIFRKQIQRLKKTNPRKAEIYSEEKFYPKLTERRRNPPEYLKGASAEVFHRDLIRLAQTLTDLIPRRDQSGKMIVSELGYNLPSKEYERERQKLINEKIVKSLKESGFEHIPKSQLKKFGRFMDAMRKQYGKKIPDSDTMAEFFNNLTYSTKKKSLKTIVDLWEEYKNNGYQQPNGGEDLFST